MPDMNERSAGVVILRDLALFNKAANLCEYTIEPAIIKVVEDLFRDWLQKSDWKGDPLCESQDPWVCPGAWKKEGEEPLAKFWFTSRPDVDSTSYFGADLCGIGQTDWGFKFEVTHSWFGGRAGWTKSFKGMTGLADEVSKRKWESVGKGVGVFFRPIRFDAKLLANAWESEDWIEFLAPLLQALNAVAADQAVFDTIIMAANPKIE